MTQVQDEVEQPLDPVRPRAERVAAGALLAVWVVSFLAALLLGHHESDYDRFEADVSAGRASAVTATEGLRPTSRGFATVEVTWRDGLVRHVAEVREVRTARGEPDVRNDGGGFVRSLVDQTVAQRVARLDPGLEVSSAGRLTGPTSDRWNWRTPGLAFAGMVVATVGALWLVVNGVRPAAATRWGWAWPVLLLAPVGVPLLLGACLRARVPAVTRTSPVTGGWSWVLTVVVGFAVFGLLEAFVA